MLSFQIEYLKTVNYALVHNHVALCQSLTITNNGDETVRNVKASIDGEYITAFQSNIISEIEPHKTIKVEPFVITPDAQKLMALTERVVSSCTITLSSSTDENSSTSIPIEFMAYDQWLGARIMPQTLVSFVTPNHPSISTIVTRAANILKELTGTPSFTAYQTRDPQNVSAQVASVFGAVHALGITYVQSVASFEESGQRIRMPEQVISSKMGNCIELTILLASVLESLGIGCGIVLQKNHAYLAVWLVDDCCRNGVCDDVTFLSKKCATGICEMIVLESTCVTATDLSMENVLRLASHNLANENLFEMMLDVRRCRLEGFLPLPQRVLQDGAWTMVENTGVQHNESELTVYEPDRYDLSNIGESKREVTRADIWERKLLDFSLRNAMLNLSIKRQNIALLGSCNVLEDMLQDGNEFHIASIPAIAIEELSNSDSVFSLELQAKLAPIINNDASHGILHSLLKEDDNQTALKKIYRSARTAIEETGANSLYLALGLLEWQETSSATQNRHAPLLLLPVEMVYKKGNYHVRGRDEEVFFNVTLIEFLHQNFNIDIPGLSPLPKDDNGVDVKKVFAIVRNAIKDQPHWNVVEQVVLGNFSFSKYVMWSDIHNHREALMANDVVRSIIQKSLTWRPTPLTSILNDVDRTWRPEAIALPVPADSSQMAAAIAASSGRSFILYGPPGTGKSQTITNMIAGALREGKRVLFVAEKMAALSVVQSRLEAIGIGPFCLEMHSNKVTKRHVLSQLDQALHVTKIQEPSEYKKTADELYDQRMLLVDEMDAIHQRGEDGFSLYDCIVHVQACDSEPIVTDEQMEPDSLTADTLAEKEELMGHELVTALSLTQAPHNNPLNGLYLKSAALEKTSALTTSLEALASTLNDVNKLSGMVAILLGNDIADTEHRLRIGAEIVEVMADMPAVSAQIIEASTSSDSLAQITATVKEQKELSAIRSSIIDGSATNGKPIRNEALDMDPLQLGMEWTAIKNKWFLPRFFATRSFVAKMRFYCPTLEAADMDNLLSKLIAHKQQQKKCSESENKTLRLLGANVEPDQIVIFSNLLPKLRTAIENAQQKLDIRDVVQRIGANATPAIRLECQQLVGTQAKWEEAKQGLLQWSNYNLDKNRMGHLAGANKQVPQWVQASRDTTGIRHWFQWCEMRRKLEQSHLSSFASALEEANCDISAKGVETLRKSYIKRLFMQKIEAKIRADIRLTTFEGLMFDEKIARFRRLTDKFRSISQRELYARLASRVPVMTADMNTSSEIGTLNRAISTGGRGQSLRNILDQVPTLIRRLCPCMLMSPMSVAQYLSLDTDKFDVVIFDEASQMPTSEAVGAIARGKHLVVVGDPKQMPPTSFFSTQSVDEDEAEVDDMDSILEDCRTLEMPALQLNYHYRSNHESLIAFSNNEYYNGSLITFPSVDNQTSRVTLEYVNGIYDKGARRHNKSEALAVVREVGQRLQSHKNQSIGIVAFSSPQQNLIEDMLQDMLDKNRNLREAAESLPEPIFVKNLENVQGDERDVILFSIGYGPDKDGKVSMNFGPLNCAGGERRLNVAVSRARQEMRVFSSLRPEQIDLQRSKALGVAGLRRFLEYAADNTLATVAETSSAQSDHVIAQNIANALRAEGFKADVGIGQSAFKIDVAVGTPDTNNHTLAIMIDGRRWQNTPTAQDREVVQPRMLSRLGWHTMRVWSQDWIMEPERVLERIRKTLNEATESDETLHETQYEVTDVEMDMTSYVVNTRKNEYKSYAPSGELTKQDIVGNIVRTEQPITLGLLAKRYATSLGQTRTSANNMTEVERMVHQDRFVIEQDRDTQIVWTAPKPDTHVIHWRPAAGRDITEIPSVEIRAAILDVLDEQLSLPSDILQLVTARKLGFQRRGANVDSALNATLSQMLKEGIIHDQNGRIMAS